MDKLVERMKTAPLEEAVAADLGFHLAVAKASGNAVLCDVIESLSGLTRSTMKYSRALAGTADDLFQKHADLFDAIREKDSARAAELMHAHLSDTAQRLKVLVRGDIGTKRPQ